MLRFFIGYMAGDSFIICYPIHDELFTSVMMLREKRRAKCSISPFALDSFQVILTLPFASYICLAILKVPKGMGCHCTVIEDCPRGGFRW